jgi:hypothetical protein
MTESSKKMRSSGRIQISPTPTVKIVIRTATDHQKNEATRRMIPVVVSPAISHPTP